MQLTLEHIAHINTKFAEMSGKEDFVDLLNYAKNIVVGENSHPFELKQITYYANPKVSGRRYKKFEIKKKSGGIRTIHSPVKGLAVIQRCLNLILQCVFTPHDAAKGFVQGRSIVDNATMHVGRKYVYNIDLKDFFPSIDQARVWKCLQLRPFNLTVSTQIQSIHDSFFTRIIQLEFGRKLGLEADEFRRSSYKANKKFLENHNVREWQKSIRALKTAYLQLARAKKDARLHELINMWWKEIGMSKLEIADLIAGLCCNEMEVERWSKENNSWEIVKRNVLPQGAATSPVVTNVVCQKLDFLLAGVAKRFGIKYTRYADDLTFSSERNIFKDGSEFMIELRRIITEQGFHVKESKVRLQEAAYRQEVTGLIVNKTVNVPQNYVKQLRMWLYNWERYGYDRAYSYFLPSYLTGRITPVKGKPDMANVIDGKLNYLKMVKGEDNEMYLKLRERFNTLIDRPVLQRIDTENRLDVVLRILVDEGLSKAMNIYKPK